MLAIDYPYRVVTTLGDGNGLTCSEYVCKEVHVAKNVVGCRSFEEAAQCVEGGNSDAVVIPGAYPEIRRLIMSRHIYADKCFLHPIPDLVLVGRSAPIPNAIPHLYHHPATVELLSDICLEIKSTVPVSSNIEACLMLLKDDIDSLAITNSICARKFKLQVHAVLRYGVAMPWICFAKKQTH